MSRNKPQSKQVPSATPKFLEEGKAEEETVAADAVENADGAVDASVATAIIAVSPAMELPHAGRRPKTRTRVQKATWHQKERPVMPTLTATGDWSFS
jgi:hypothetical protein